MHRYGLFACCLFAGFLGMAGCPVPTDEARAYERCVTIEDDALRLRCYDEAAGRKPKEPVSDVAPAPPSVQPALAAGPTVSLLSRLWQLDTESRRRRFAIMPYRHNYLLPYTVNFAQEKAAYEKAYPGTELQDMEAKFQISLKMKLWQDIFGTDLDLWAAYTQVSMWQVYNTAYSSPFRETNYEPEILLNYRTQIDLGGLRNRFVQVGLNHQSNGRGRPLSRSWNRLTANFGFERGDFNLLLKTWVRIPEKESNDDNPDIASYLGYGEIWAGTVWKDFHFALMLRNNLRFDENRGAVQAEVSFPIHEYLNGYIQYFVGYGETLIDYNHYANRIGFGVMVKAW